MGDIMHHVYIADGHRSNAILGGKLNRLNLSACAESILGSPQYQNVCAQRQSIPTGVLPVQHYTSLMPVL